MGQASLNYSGTKGSLDINGIIENYYVYAGENISAGDFVEFINGIASKKTETSVDTPISTNSYNGKTISAVVLDDNRVFIAHSHSTNYYLLGIVCTINGATIIPGVDTMLDANNYRGVTISAVKSEDNKVFVAHSAGTAIHLYSVVCTIDNTTITVGTDTMIVSNDNAGHAISVIPLTDNRVFIAHCNGTAFHLYGIICTITGTTITIGTDVSLDSVQYSGFCVSVVKLEDNKAFVAHNDGAAYYLFAMICTISGTAISQGTDTALVSGYEHCGDYISTGKLTNTKVFIAHSRSSSYYLNALVCTINSTTITPGTDYALDSTSFESEGISTVVLPSEQVFVSHRDSSQYLGGIVCTINNTTITNGGDKTLSSNNFQGTTTSSVLIDDNIFIAHSYDKDTRYLYAQIWSIDEVNNKPTNQIITEKYETQVRPTTTLPCDAIANTTGVGGNETSHNETVDIVRSPLIQHFTTTVEKEENVFVHKISGYPIKEYDTGMLINIEADRIKEPQSKTFTNDLFKQNWTVESGYLTATAEDGTVVTCSTSSASPALAFDGSTSTAWTSRTTQRVETFSITFPEEIELTKLKLMVNGLASVKLTISGGSSRNSLTQLYSEWMTNLASLTTIALTNTGKYKYYEIEIPKMGTGYTAYIYELRAAEWSKIVEYTTLFTNPYINVNGLGNKLINGIIEYGKKYQLRYNGTSFDIVGGE